MSEKGLSNLAGTKKEIIKYAIFHISRKQVTTKHIYNEYDAKHNNNNNNNMWTYIAHVSTN